MVSKTRLPFPGGCGDAHNGEEVLVYRIVIAAVIALVHVAGTVPAIAETYTTDLDGTATFGYDANPRGVFPDPVGYGVFGVLWIMLLICPYCRLFGTAHCPGGYGAVASKLRAAGDFSLFAEKFRRHTPVLYLLWVLPPVVAGVALWRRFDPLVAALVAAFALDAFVLLPVLSKKLSCSTCPQRDVCPRMVGGRGAREHGS